MAFTPKDWKDYPDTSTPITAAALEDLETRVVEYGNTYVTSLPSSPADGQEIYYAADATNGVIWHLRYRSGGGTYKWEFVGGGALKSEYTTGETNASFGADAVAAGSFTAVSVTTPLEGDYLVRHEAGLGLYDTGHCGIGVSVDAGSPAYMTLTYAPGTGSETYPKVSVSQQRIITGVAASKVLRQYYTQTHSPDNGFKRYYGTMHVTPIRLKAA